MTNPFTAFAFAATGGSANRTMPARLAEVHNVKEFGATGDGITDDLGAIMDAIDWRTSTDLRGTIYFPPGTYYVSAPIDFSATASPQASGLFVAFRGEMGLTTIVGDFADYVLKRGVESTPRWDGHWDIERLTIINRHAGGGGIRLGATQGSSIRDCDITADVAINDDNTDNFIDGGNVNGAFELLIENCNCRPYNTLATGSIGLYKCSDGPVTNCTFTGFDVGTCTASGQGGAAFLGCYWEGNNYGFFPGHGVEAWAGSGSNFVLEGGHFKNNGIAIYGGGGSGIYHGVYIEAATGSISGNPQYGIRVVSGGAGTFAGMSINGDFQQYGVSFVGGESIRKMQSCTAVGSVNSVSSPTKNWQLAEAKCSLLKNVNKAAVFTVNTLPAVRATVTAASWSSGTVSMTFSTGVDVNPSNTKDLYLTITGMTPSGYNGTYTGFQVDGSHLTYPLVSNPGTATVMGTVFFTAGDPSTRNAFEGDCYNVSDANTATWGAAITAGGGSNHVKARFTAAAWTVVGK